MALATDVNDPRTDQWRGAFPEHRTWKGRDLALVPTVFDRLERRPCQLLIYRGWWLTAATLARYHPGLITQLIAPPRLD